MRTTIAARPSAMAKAGIASRIRCLPGSSEILTYPPAGTSFHIWAKTRIINVPATKTGMPWAKPARKFETRSKLPPCRKAAATPTGTPMIKLRIAAAAISSSVRGRRLAISGATGEPSIIELPRSKRMRPDIRSTYCVSIGRSRPRSLRNCATEAASGVEPSPESSSSAGSPGTI
ncbi:hypothetical protein D3C87_1284430 [compost metagenome]